MCALMATHMAPCGMATLQFWHKKGSFMIERHFSRRQMLMGAGTLAVLGPTLIPTAVLAAAADDSGRLKLLRWDLVSVRDGVVIPGGTDVGRDAGTGDTISMTGSGQAEPHEREANGGGTFVHMDSSGNTRASGVFLVTGFRDLDHVSGSLVGVGLQDGVGELGETTGGILTLGVRLIPDSGSPHEGVMTVDCDLPGARFAIHEGITLSVAGTALHFTQDSGTTLFHVLEGASSE